MGCWIGLANWASGMSSRSMTIWAVPHLDWWSAPDFNAWWLQSVREKWERFSASKHRGWRAMVATGTI
jgi:hypothetical protein